MVLAAAASRIATARPFLLIVFMPAADTRRVIQRPSSSDQKRLVFRLGLNLLKSPKGSANIVKIRGICAQMCGIIPFVFAICCLSACCVLRLSGLFFCLRLRLSRLLLLVEQLVEHADGEGRGAVDNLAPVRTALLHHGVGATAIQTVPTGFWAEPPVGPAMPVVATA